MVMTNHFIDRHEERICFNINKKLNKKQKEKMEKKIKSLSFFATYHDKDKIYKYTNLKTNNECTKIVSTRKNTYITTYQVNILEEANKFNLNFAFFIPQNLDYVKMDSNYLYFYYLENNKCIKLTYDLESNKLILMNYCSISEESNIKYISANYNKDDIKELYYLIINPLTIKTLFAASIRNNKYSFYEDLRFNNTCNKVTLDYDTFNIIKEDIDFIEEQETEEITYLDFIISNTINYNKVINEAYYTFELLVDNFVEITEYKNMTKEIMKIYYMPKNEIEERYNIEIPETKFKNEMIYHKNIYNII